MLRREKARSDDVESQPQLTLDQVWCGDGPRHTTELPASVINQGHSQGLLKAGYRPSLSLLV